MSAAAECGELITALEESYRSGSSARRVDILRRLTDLFLGQATHLNDVQLGLFDAIIERLADQLERHVLKELAERLAAVPNAPHKIVRRLAAEDISIARPILTRSRRLQELDLVEIASSSEQAHLLAISEREELTARVTDVLVTRGDRDVVHSTARNAKAQFSEYGFSTLVDRSADDEELQERLSERSDLPSAQAQKLIQQATNRVRERIRNNPVFCDQDDDALIRIVAESVRTMLDAKKNDEFVYTEAISVVDSLIRSGQFSEAELVSFAEAGRQEEVIVGLARLARLPVELVERLWLASQSDGLVILMRSLRLSWRVARAIVRLAHDQGDPAEIDGVEQRFCQLQPNSAELVTRFWRVREQALGPRAK